MSKLIHKVLIGQATHEEQEELSAWIASSPEHAEEFEDMKILYEKSDDTDSHKEAYHKISDAIRTLIRKRKREKSMRVIGSSICISALVFVSTIYGPIFYQKWQTENYQQNRLSSIVLTDNLEFTGATVESIFEKLQEDYSVQFIVESEAVLTCKFTGMFYKGLSVGEMIAALAEADNFKYRFIDKKTMEISGKGCPT